MSSTSPSAGSTRTLRRVCRLAPLLILFNAVIDNGPDGYGFERIGDYWEDFSPPCTT